MLQQYLFYGYPIGNETFYQGIYKLLPGHYAEWDGEKVSAKSEKFALLVGMMEESACGKPQEIDSAKYLAKSPSKPRPWRASSFAIS